MNEEALKKYSYLLITASKDPSRPQGIGTACFYEKNGMYILISAGHLFNGVDAIHNKPIPLNEQWDTVKLRIYNSLTQKMEYISIPIHQFKESPFWYFEKPDLQTLESSTHSPGLVINTINEFIDNYKNAEGNPAEVFYYGYSWPISNGDIQGDTLQPLYYQGSKHVGNIWHAEKNPIVPSLDLINYFANIKGDRGNSGSPVFYKFSKVQNGQLNEYVTFGGIMIAVDNDNNKSIIIKPEIVIQRLQ